MLSIEHPDGLDDWDAVTPTVERAMLLRLAIDRALAAVAAEPDPAA